MAECWVDGGGGDDIDDDDDDDDEDEEDAWVFSLKSASIILSFTASSLSSVGTSRPFESFCRYQGIWTTDSTGCDVQHIVSASRVGGNKHGITWLA